MKLFNKIALQKLNGVYIGPLVIDQLVVRSKNSTALVASLNKNIEYFGYSFTPTAIEVLKRFTSEFLSTFNSTLLSDLKELKNVPKYKPFYVNFPSQVMEMGEAELYMNAVLHYFTAENGLPIYTPSVVEEKRGKLKDQVDLKPLNIVYDSDIHGYFRELMQSNTSISESDKENLIEYLNTNDVNIDFDIKYKEIMSVVYSTLLTNGKENNITVKFNNSTDVLRLAVALSGGDVSLSENTKFRNFSRRERRFLISKLNEFKDINNTSSDMMVHRNAWIRLGEKLHPLEFTNVFPNAASCFSNLRNSKVKTFNSELVNCKSEVNKLLLASTKPGVYIRNLDSFLRKFKKKGLVISTLSEVVGKISTPVLLQVYTYYKNRNNDTTFRAFLPKGSLAKIQLVDNKLPKVAESYVSKIIKIIDDELSNRFSKLSPLGNCYIEDSIKELVIPFSERSASEQEKTIARSSRVPLGSGDTVRFFLWWKNPMRDIFTDVDLSATMYDSDFKQIGMISYYNLKETYACHSGDIRNAPKGASEYIDVDMKKLKKVYSNARYIFMNISMFSGSTFSDLSECSAGFMMRSDVNSGQIYEPKTCEQSFKVNSKSQTAVPLIIDVENRQMIWCDMQYPKNQRYVNNVSANSRNIATVGRAIVEIKKMTFGELFMKHVTARGKLVTNKEDADTIFSSTEGITPYNFAKIGAEFIK